MKVSNSKKIWIKWERSTTRSTKSRILNSLYCNNLFSLHKMHTLNTLNNLAIQIIIYLIGKLYKCYLRLKLPGKGQVWFIEGHLRVAHFSGRLTHSRIMDSSDIYVGPPLAMPLTPIEFVKQPRVLLKIGALVSRPTFICPKSITLVKYLKPIQSNELFFILWLLSCKYNCNIYFLKFMKPDILHTWYAIFRMCFMYFFFID